MTFRRFVFGSLSHGLMLLVGFVIGVYTLPILTAPSVPDIQVLEKMSEQAVYSGTINEDLRGHDFLHWGEGTISITDTQIIHKGRLAPGPDYKLYLVSDFAEHEDEFLPLKSSAQYIADVKSFNGFIFDIPSDVDTSQYNTVLVWCEAFSEFITAVKYQ